MKNKLWWAVFAVGATLTLSNAISAPQWQAKPVQCAKPEEVIQTYVIPEDLKAEFLAVGQVRTQDQINIPQAVVFWVNKETGHWMFMEGDKSWVCVIGLGTQWETDLDTEQLKSMFTGKYGT